MDDAIQNQGVPRPPISIGSSLFPHVFPSKLRATGRLRSCFRRQLLSAIPDDWLAPRQVGKGRVCRRDRAAVRPSPLSSPLPVAM
jgi:hypothetical protein